MDGTQSQLRVFLGADLVGSTRLKNELNHQLLSEKYEMSLHLINQIHSVRSEISLNDNEVKNAVLKSLGIGGDDFDWASVVETFYRDFHAQFSAEFKSCMMKLGEVDQDCKPWKAVGDELIYQFKVKSRRHLYWIVFSFLKALRRSDKNVVDGDKAGKGLRIKGTAWVAGFPVRNRVVTLPAINQEDFLGPDIDTGFRIGKCSRAGMLVVSVELAELLAETEDLDPFMGMIVGWESMKGVWNDNLYPIVWIDLPAGAVVSDSALKAVRFNDWRQEECRFCRSWEKRDKNQLRLFIDPVRDLRKELPPSLGLVDPYIVSDLEVSNEVPNQHKKIHELQTLIEEYLKLAGTLGEDQEKPARADMPKDRVKDMVEEVLDAEGP